MKIRTTVLVLAATIVVVACLLAFTGVSFNRSNLGEVELGMTKAEVVTRLLAIGVSYVEPTTAERVASLSTSHSVAAIVEQSGADVCISDGRGIYYLLKFSSSREVKNIVSRSSDEMVVGIQVEIGDSAPVVTEKLQKLMARNGALKVYSCIVGESVRIDHDDSTVRRLDRFDTWFIYLPNSYSTARLRFSNGRLEEIEYHWKISEW